MPAEWCIGTFVMDNHIATLLDHGFLPPDRTRDPLGVRDLSFADVDFLFQHGFFLDPDLLLLDGDAYLLALADRLGGWTAIRGVAFDDDLFLLDGHLEGLLF